MRKCVLEKIGVDTAENEFLKVSMKWGLPNRSCTYRNQSFTSSCPSGAFFRYSHFWLLYGFRIGSDRKHAACTQANMIDFYSCYTLLGSVIRCAPLTLKDTIE